VAEAQRDVLGDRDAVVPHHRLEQILVHTERRCEYSGTDVRHARQLEQSLDGPVLAERAVEHREDDVDVGEGPRNVAGSKTRIGFVARATLDRGAPGAERPAALAVDLDGHDLVAAQLECCDHARRGRHRDGVLARPAAEDHGDAAAHGPVVIGVVVVVPGAACPFPLPFPFPLPLPLPLCASWPTWMITTSPEVAFAPPAGSCEMTMPSCEGSVTGSTITETFKPACWRILVASAWL